MAPSSWTHTLSATLLSLAALASAHPYQNGMQVAEAQQATLAVYFQAGINSYVQSVPEEVILEQQRIVEVTNAEAAAAKACEDVFLIFARGTFEPGGSDFMGIMVGAPFLSQLKNAMGGKRLGSAGVDYSNSVAGYIAGGDYEGSIKMAQMIDKKAGECPNTKLVVSGYSQGAQLAHNALGKVKPETLKSVAAVVVFGDPYKDKPIRGIPNSNIFTNCAVDDPICKGQPIPLGSHLTYGSDTAQMSKTVQFVKSHV